MDLRAASVGGGGEMKEKLVRKRGGADGEHVFHVLAVDDSVIDRKLLERLLTGSSYQVTCVDSGDKALEYLNGLLEKIKENEFEISTKCDHQEVSKVNLIMTDYSMPGISGYDLLKRIKDSYWKDVPVVVMSSENVPSRINMCLEGGAEEFLLKPVKPSDLSKLHSHILKKAIPKPHESICREGKSATTKDDDVDNCTNGGVSVFHGLKATCPGTACFIPHGHVLCILATNIFFLILFYFFGCLYVLR